MTTTRTEKKKEYEKAKKENWRNKNKQWRKRKKRGEEEWGKSGEMRTRKVRTERKGRNMKRL